MSAQISELSLRAHSELRRTGKENRERRDVHSAAAEAFWVEMHRHLPLPACATIGVTAHQKHLDPLFSIPSSASSLCC